VKINEIYIYTINHIANNYIQSKRDFGRIISKKSIQLNTLIFLICLEPKLTIKILTIVCFDEVYYRKSELELLVLLQRRRE
jgi:hypothetical protein